MSANRKKFPIYTEISREAETFCEFIDSEVFDYPFFNEGVRKLRNPQPFHEKYLLTDLNKPSDENLLEVKGFIFHTSHCGSTLLSRMLSQSPEIRVVSESEAINGLLLSYLFHGLKKKETLEKLALIINAYRQPLNQEKYLFFKMTSWNVFMANLFQELYPSVKWFYLDRDTREVVNSLQRSAGGMQEWFYHPVDILRRHFVGKERIFTSEEDYLTNLVEQHRKQAVLFKNDNLCFTTYPDFLDQFESTILAHLNLSYAEEAIDKMKTEMNYYSKSHEKKLFTNA